MAHRACLILAQGGLALEASLSTGLGNACRVSVGSSRSGATTPPLAAEEAAFSGRSPMTGVAQVGFTCCQP